MRPNGRMGAQRPGALTAGSRANRSSMPKAFGARCSPVRCSAFVSQRLATRHAPRSADRRTTTLVRQNHLRRAPAVPRVATNRRNAFPAEPDDRERARGWRSNRGHHRPGRSAWLRHAAFRNERLLRAERRQRAEDARERDSERNLLLLLALANYYSPASSFAAYRAEEAAARRNSTLRRGRGRPETSPRTGCCGAAAL